MNTFAFIIVLVVVLLAMIYATVFVLYNKNKKQRNKVRFFVCKTQLGILVLILLDKVDGTVIANSSCFARYGLNAEDFADMKPMGRKEVFLNMED